MAPNDDASTRLVLVSGVVTGLAPSLIAAVCMGPHVVAGMFPIFGLLPGIVSAGVAMGALRLAFRVARPSILLSVLVTIPSIVLAVALTFLWTIVAWGRGPP